MMAIKELYRIAGEHLRDYNTAVYEGRGPRERWRLARKYTDTIEAAFDYLQSLDVQECKRIKEKLGLPY